MIRFRCPSCQKVLQTKEDKVGKKVRCPCAAVIVVPSQSAPEPKSVQVAANRETRIATCPACMKKLRAPVAAKAIKCPCGHAFRIARHQSPEMEQSIAEPANDEDWLADLPPVSELQTSRPNKPLRIPSQSHRATTGDRRKSQANKSSVKATVANDYLRDAENEIREREEREREEAVPERGAATGNFAADLALNLFLNL